MTQEPLKNSVERHRRLALLVCLSLAPRYLLTQAILKEQLEGSGYIASTATLNADVGFLEETGLVDYAGIGPAQTVKLTERGLDIALGNANMPGVGRPGPV